MLVLIGSAGASCRPQIPARPASASNAAPSLGDAMPAGALPWSSARPLAWSDFRGRPPAGHAEAAVTATGVIWGFHCTGDTFTFQVAAVFLPDRSWVDPSVSIQLGSGMGTLRHEQTHFDLTEVYARRMRQAFGTLSRPCDRTEEQLAGLGERFVRDESDAQRRYDEATANGRAAPAQSRWENDVQHWLEDLGAFTRLR